MNHTMIANTRRRDAWAVAFALGLPTLVTLAYFVLAPRFGATVQQTTYVASKCFQFAFPLLWVLAVQRERFGLNRPTSAGVPIGVGFGLVVLVATLALYYALLKTSGLFDDAAAPIREKVGGFGIDSAPKYFAFAVFYAICHSFLEEYYWRWFVFGQLRKLMRLGPAVLLSSVGFMAHHLLVLGIFFGWSSPATWLFSLCVGIGGAAWAVIYDRAGSLVSVWASHLLVDAAIFLVGYDLVKEMLN